MVPRNVRLFSIYLTIHLRCVHRTGGGGHQEVLHNFHSSTNITLEGGGGWDGRGNLKVRDHFKYPLVQSEDRWQPLVIMASESHKLGYLLTKTPEFNSPWYHERQTCLPPRYSQISFTIVIMYPSLVLWNPTSERTDLRHKMHQEVAGSDVTKLITKWASY